MANYMYKAITRFLAVAMCVCILALSACISDNATGTTYNKSTSYTLSNIAYGSDAQQKMDIYLPANRSADSAKVFVLIHGGGWKIGRASCRERVCLYV